MKTIVPLIRNTRKTSMTRETPNTTKKILISPLNWGFGHAGRMIPLALELGKRGHEVIFCADKTVIPMLSRELPGITIEEIRGLQIRYFRKTPVWVSVLLHLPHMAAVSIREHRELKRLAAEHGPDIVISDNRFGFRHKQIFSVYVTHQIRIPFPAPLRFMEPFGVWLHRKIIERFDLCLIPDFPGDINLSGRLSHGVRLPRNTVWSGPLSRFNSVAGTGHLTEYDTSAKISTLAGSDNSEGTGTLPGSDSTAPPALTPVIDAPTPVSTTASPVFTIPAPYLCLILSGPEPQRSILKEKVAAAVTTVAAATTGMHLVILDGSGEHNAIARAGNVTVVSNPDTALMKAIITGSTAVISRSGYTTLMELVSLHKGAIIIPTPGQPEQEYLGEHFDKKWGFVTLGQNKIKEIRSLAYGLSRPSNHELPFSGLTHTHLSAPGLPASNFCYPGIASAGTSDTNIPGEEISDMGFPVGGLLLDAAIRRLTEEEI